MTTPPGWYPDPGGSGGRRWWDGSAWTATLEPAAAQQYAPAWQVAPQPQRTSGKAIGALVASIICGIGSIVGIVLGSLALRDVRRSNGTVGGSGLAITGITLGGLGLLATPFLLAIALPVFLHQRDTATRNELRDVLRNAATAEESYWTDHQTYTTSVEALRGEGLEVPEAIALHVARADASLYCIEALHDDLPDEIWHYDVLAGEALADACAG